MVRRAKKTDNRKVKNAKKLNINGLEFKSLLEAYVYNQLIEAGINNFGYESHHFPLMQGFEFNNFSIEHFNRKDRKSKAKLKYYENVTNKIRPITYVPDFVCINEDTKEGWIIEAKGYPNDSFPLKWKLFKKFLVDNGYNVSLYKPNNQENVRKTINIIKNKYYV